MSVVQIAANATVPVTASTTNSFNFAGADRHTRYRAGAVVTGVITGFAAGDKINFIHQPVTGETLSSAGGTTVLKLYDGAALVDTVTFQGGSIPVLSFKADGSGAPL